MEKFEEKLRPGKKQETEIQPPKFEIEDFEDSREQFVSLVRQLTPAIDNHEYDLVIGDDASGRLLTLVIGGLIKEVYKKDKIESPKILFLAGGRRTSQDVETQREKNIINYLETKFKNEKIDASKTKTLFCTEYISSGRTMNEMVKILQQVGISPDIAALLLCTECYPALKDKKVYAGHKAEIAYPTSFWKNYSAAGVQQDIHNEERIFSKRTKINRSTALKARRDVKRMIDYLKQIYDREKEGLEKQNEN